MHDLAGTFALQYNRRKERTGAYWEGRYHCTMVDSGPYLWACLQYIDLNMVRAGVVKHPDQWKWTGWQEIMGQRKRYCLIDQNRLTDWTGHIDLQQFRQHYAHDLTEKMQQRYQQRESQWTEAVAVGSEAFVKSVTEKLPSRRRWQIEATTIAPRGCIVREPSPAYMRFSPPKTVSKTL